MTDAEVWKNIMQLTNELENWRGGALVADHHPLRELLRQLKTYNERMNRPRPAAWEEPETP